MPRASHVSAAIALLLSLFGRPHSHAINAILTDDAHVNTARPNANYGSSKILQLRQRQPILLKFDFGTLPNGTTSAAIRKATLKLWIDRVVQPGTFDIAALSSDWQEETVKASNLPVAGPSEISEIPVTPASRKRFLVLDITPLVRDWVDELQPNHGLILKASPGSTPFVLFSSKEDLGTAHLAEIEVSLASMTADGTSLLDASLLAEGILPNARLDQELQAIASLPSAVDKLPFFAETGVAAVVDFPVYARSLVASADAATARNTLGAQTGVWTEATGGTGSTGGLPHYNVKDFGAVGDGVADDSVAVQAAVNRAAAADGKGTVHFPSGTYRLNVELPRWVTITGARSPGRSEAFAGLPQAVPGATAFTPADASKPVIEIRQCLGQSIRDVRIDGGGAFVAGTVGIRVSGSNAKFAGTGLHMSGVEVRDFETGVLYLANRGLFEHCSFMSCVFGFKAETSSDGLPSDTLTFTNCSAGGARETSAGVWEPIGQRTNYGWHLAGNIKGAGFYNCEMGQCGTALFIDGVLASHISASNFEGNDTGAIRLITGGLAIDGVNSFSGDQPFIHVKGPGNLVQLSIRTRFVITSYPALIRIEGEVLRPDVYPPCLIEYVDSALNRKGFMQSDGERIQATRITTSQTLTPGNGSNTIHWNAVSGNYTGNFNTATGEWQCPKSGRYRMRVRLKTGGTVARSELYYVATSASQGGIALDGGFLVRKDTPHSANDYVEGSADFNGIQGAFYRTIFNQASAAPLQVEVGVNALSGSPEGLLTIEEVK